MWRTNEYFRKILRDRQVEKGAAAEITDAPAGGAETGAMVVFAGIAEELERNGLRWNPLALKHLQ